MLQSDESIKRLYGFRNHEEKIEETRIFDDRAVVRRQRRRQALREAFHQDKGPHHTSAAPADRVISASHFEPQRIRTTCHTLERPLDRDHSGPRAKTTPWPHVVYLMHDYGLRRNEAFGLLPKDVRRGYISVESQLKAYVIKGELQTESIRKDKKVLLKKKKISRGCHDIFSLQKDCDQKNQNSRIHICSRQGSR